MKRALLAVAGRCIAGLIVIGAVVCVRATAEASTACGTPPPGSLFFVTDRERATDEQLFTGERSEGEGLATMTAGVLEHPDDDPAVTTCGSLAGLVRSLGTQFDRKRGRQVIVFVHGYFTTFRQAMTTATGLQRELRFPGPMIAYSWPARATSQLAYGTDEKNAGWSMIHFRLMIEEIERRYPGIPISIVVHSLGSRFLTYGVSVVGMSGCKSCFGRGIAFAPDEDASTLRAALEDVGLCKGLPPAAPGHPAPLTIYVSNNDRALRASQRYHGGDERAGQAGRKMLLCGGVDTVDVSYYKTSDKFGHSYELDPPIVADARAALAGVSPASPARNLRSVKRDGLTYYELGR